MIQAGTIRTGSAITLSVAGLYWISSISSLRNTTSPGVMATSSPTVKWSSRGAGSMAMARSDVLLEIESCRARDWRRLPACVRSMITGLSQGMLDGETASSAWRAHEGDAGGAFGRHAADGPCRAPPPFLLREERLLPEGEGEALPSLVLEAPVVLGRGEWFLVSRSLGGGVEHEARQPRRRVQGEKRQAPSAGRAPGRDARPIRTRRRTRRAAKCPG